MSLKKGNKEIDTDRLQRHLGTDGLVCSDSVRFMIRQTQTTAITYIAANPSTIETWSDIDGGRYQW